MLREGWTSTAAVLAAGILLASSCAEWQADRDGFTEQDRALIALMALPQNPPAPANESLVGEQPAQRLGQALFFDPELSGKLKDPVAGQVSLGAAGTAGRIACADCHAPNVFFDDVRTSPNNVSLGIDFLGRNSPSLVNVAFYTSFAWDGRSDSLWMQCGVAHESRGAMGGTRLRLARRLAARYAAPYQSLFGPTDFARLDRGDAGTDTEFDLADGGERALAPGSAAAAFVDQLAANAYKAMAAYLAVLVSRDAPIDAYAGGDLDALTPAAKRGLKVFLGRAGCVECHRGAHFTDNQYHSVGVGQRGDHVPAVDEGRFTGLSVQRDGAQAVFSLCGPYGLAGRACAAPPTADDVGRFRTKSLRNVARTPPYMHAGQLDTLEDVVRFYNRGGDSTGFAGAKAPQVVPLGLTEAEVQDLIAFLEALTGAAVPAGLTCDPSPRDGSPGAHRFPACLDGGF